MSSRPCALSIALDLACRQRDAARRRLQTELASQSAARAQLDQLQDYARETAARWGMQAGATRHGDWLQHYGQFIARLAHAAAIQTGVLDAHTASVEDAQRALLQTQLRVTGLDTLMAGRRQQMARGQLRQEQKQSDEWAARKHSGAGWDTVFQHRE